MPTPATDAAELTRERLDLTSEQTAVMPLGAGPGAPAWTAAEVNPEACVLRLDDDAIGEALALARDFAAHPLPTVLRERGATRAPRLAATMRRAIALLDGTPGVAVIDALPLDAIGEEAGVDLFWLLGQHLGRPVAQKWDGTMLYHVRDTGEAFGYGVRGSYTNVELSFHTDNAFGVAPPERVGLLCLQPAAEGGMSRFCSLVSVHERLRLRSPALLERLYRPLPWDRQAEHAPGAPRVAMAPMFRYAGGRLSARANLSLVRRGYALAGETPDTLAAQALDALAEVLAEPDLTFELPLARGHLQYLDNRRTAHYRSAFADPPGGPRRHLVRSWHRAWGRRSYDG